MSINQKFIVGDIVTGRRKGWWRITKFEDYVNNNFKAVRIHLELALDQYGNPPKKKARTDVVFSSICEKLTAEDIIEYREHDCKKWDILMKLVNPDAEVEHEESAEEVTEQMELPEPKFLTMLGPPSSLFRNKEND